MVLEVELIDRQFFGESGLTPSEMDGVVPTVLQFEVREGVRLFCYDASNPGFPVSCPVMPGN